MRERDEETHELMCELNSDELLAKGTQLAAALAKVKELEAQLKNAASLFKARIEEARDAATLHAEEVSARAEKRPVVCRWKLDGSQWLLRRSDTNKLVRSEAMTSEDLQEALPYPQN
jgi:hypothetical protein